MTKHTKDGISWFSWPLLDQYGITAGTTCRRTEKGRSFDLSFRSPEEKEAARTNRQALCTALGVDPASLTTAEQVHGCNSRILPEEKSILSETDAFILTDSSVLGTILTADCLPVVLYDRKKKIGAVIHAGWKGTAGGIVPLTLRRMVDELACDASEMLAAGGPSIGPCCYQVDLPVFKTMTENYPETRPAFRPDGTNHWKLSLEKAVRFQLMEEGLSPDRIALAGLCSCCHPDFFSWRGDGKDTGRIGTFLRI